MLESIKAFCDSLLKLGLPGFDLSVYHKGRSVIRYMNGYSDLENKIPVQGNERYNLYSCSKPVTCAAALRLWEQGAFSLADRLSDYMPEFSDMTYISQNGVKPTSRPILIRHLFEMTAGFSYDCFSPSLQKARAETEGKCRLRDVMRYLAKEPLLFEPGERWEYGFCHDVLAALVEELTGESFEDHIKKTVFDPLGMQDSTFLLPQGELASVAPLYKIIKGRVLNEGKEIGEYKLGSEYASGGAGLVSTVNDYMKFLEALRNGRILNEETLALMTKNRLAPEQKQAFWLQSPHGYGLGVRCPIGVSPYEDFGWGGAACSYFAVDLKNEISLFFGAHALSPLILKQRGLLYRLIRAALVEPSDFDRVFEECGQLMGFSANR